MSDTPRRKLLNVRSTRPHAGRGHGVRRENSKKYLQMPIAFIVEFSHSVCMKVLDCLELEL